MFFVRSINYVIEMIIFFYFSFFRQEELKSTHIYLKIRNWTSIKLDIDHEFLGQAKKQREDY